MPMKTVRNVALALALLPLLATLKGDPLHYQILAYMEHAFVFPDGSFVRPWMPIAGRI